MKFFVTAGLLLTLTIVACAQDDDALVLASPWSEDADDPLLQREPVTRPLGASLASLLEGAPYETPQGRGFRRVGRVWGGVADSWRQVATPVQDTGDTPVTDFGDLHQFNIRFDTLRAEQLQALRSLEIVGQHLWSRRAGLLTNKPALRLNLHGIGVAVELGDVPMADAAGPVEPPATVGWFAGAKSVDYLAYGLRMNQGIDEFQFDGISDVLGYTGSNTRVDHWAIGPQVSVGRVTAIDKWMFDLSGHLMLAYSRVEIEQSNQIGSGLQPGALNRPLLLQPTYTTHGRSHDHFSPHAEVRLASGYAIRRDWTADAMLRGYVTGPWYESSELVDYSLPDLGIRGGDPGAHIGWNLYLGVTYLR